MVSSISNEFCKNITLNGKTISITKAQNDKRTPGIFKLEWKGKAMIALASKMYYGVPEEGGKPKISMKGIQKEKNKRLSSFESFKKVLNTRKTIQCQNIGMRFDPILKSMTTYNTNKIGLTPIYVKRFILDDGINTVPLLNAVPKIMQVKIELKHEIKNNNESEDDIEEIKMKPKIILKKNLLNLK